MRTLSPLRLMAGLFALLALIAAVQLFRPGIVLSQHEGDTLHLMDMLLRLQDGQRIHEDFRTPLGILSLAPLLLMLKAGLTGAQALLSGQLALMACLVPLIAFVTASRLPGFAAALTGGYLVILGSALIDGGTSANIGLSMSYNRWAWVLACLALLPALLPIAGRKGQLRDGTVIGLCIGLLVLIKVTFVLAILPAVLLGVLVRRHWHSFGAALAAGLLVMALATLWGGTGFWTAYIEDLALVAASPLRSWPSQPLSAILSGPAFLPANLLVIGAVVLLRQSGARDEGLVLLALLPGLIYIVAQNFGNDPQWLVLLAAVLLARMPMERMRGSFGLDLRAGALVLVAGALVMTMPSALNLASSGFRHFAADRSTALPMVPGNPRMAGLLLDKQRLHRFRAGVALDEPRFGAADLRELSGREPLLLGGEELEFCQTSDGYEVITGRIAARLEALGYGGAAIWTADLLNPLWLFGDFPALRGVAPWSYGGLPGAEAAELVLVPACPLLFAVLRDSIDGFAARGIPLTEVHREPLFRLLQPGSPG